MLHRWICPGFLYEGYQRGTFTIGGFMLWVQPTVSVLNPAPATTSFDARFVDDNGAGIPFHMSGVLPAQCRRSYKMTGGFSLGWTGTEDGVPVKRFSFSGWIDIIGYPNPIIPEIVSEFVVLPFRSEEVEPEDEYFTLPVVHVDLTGAPTVALSPATAQAQPPTGGTPLPWETNAREVEYLIARYSQPLYDIATDPRKLVESVEFIEADGLEELPPQAHTTRAPALIRLTRAMAAEEGARIDPEELVRLLGVDRATADVLLEALTGQGG